MAVFSGISVRAVRRIAGEANVTHDDDGAGRKARQIGRRSGAEAYREVVAAVPDGEPDLLSVELCRRARLAGYTAGKSAMHALIASLRPAKIDAMRLDAFLTPGLRGFTTS